jgi:hypothetical protein
VSLRIPSSSRSPDHDPRRTIYYLGYPLGRFASLKHRQAGRRRHVEAAGEEGRDRGGEPGDAERGGRRWGGGAGGPASRSSGTRTVRGWAPREVFFANANVVAQRVCASGHVGRGWQKHYNFGKNALQIVISMVLPPIWSFYYLTSGSDYGSILLPYEWDWLWFGPSITLRVGLTWGVG